MQQQQEPTNLVLPILVQLQAALLRLLPHGRYARIDVRLMQNLGDDGRELGVVDEGRVGSRELGVGDGVGGAVFEEERNEREDLVDGDDEEEDNEGEEDGQAATHGCGNFGGDGWMDGWMEEVQWVVEVRGFFCIFSSW